ncbi:MAG: ECF-type sigma factor, partial [Longimicrobiales bacterium]
MARRTVSPDPLTATVIPGRVEKTKQNAAEMARRKRIGRRKTPAGGSKRAPGGYSRRRSPSPSAEPAEALEPTLYLVRQEDEFVETVALKNLTDVLHAAGNGDEDAKKLLFERVYGELRRLARGQMVREFGKPSLLQTTALVNEAYLRLVGEAPVDWQNRRHFFGAAIQAMKRILVDYARKRDADRRGGGRIQVSLADQAVEPAPTFDALDLHDALDRLGKIRPRVARVVEHRFLLGLTVEETADLLAVSARTVDSDWK